VSTLTETTKSHVSKQEALRQQNGCHKEPGTGRMPWYNVILCRSGIHRGNWVYLAGGACSQLRVCQRCGKADRRTKHQRQWQYFRSRDCTQVKTCMRCAEKGRQRTRHIWGSAYSSGSDRARDCDRCGKHEEWSTDAYND
jgi:hypothetical protein